MIPEDELKNLLQPKLDPRLQAHISNVDLGPISRIPAQRLATTALPHIELIEFVPSEVFATKYLSLYEALFHGGERERGSLIVDRLADDSAGRRTGLAPYRLIGIRDHDGHAIAAAHFSVLPLNTSSADDGGGSGRGTAVPYLQYIYVAASHRRRDLSELLHTLILGVTIADARALGRSDVVPFTLFETEPPGHNERSGVRTQIHARGGSVALMMKRASDARVLTAHVQPGLEVGEPPITLVWVLRPNPRNGTVVDDGSVRELGAAVIGAYYQSLRDEGFPEENIALSEEIVAKRMVDCEFCILPLAEVTDEMYRGID